MMFVFIITNSFSQVHNEKIVISNGNGGLRVQNIKNKKVSVSGSFYYSETWAVGIIKLFSGETIEGYPLKYDMKMNQIDIKVDNEIKAISIGAVKEVDWTKNNGQKETLANATLYNKNVEGFYSILYKGKISLFKKTNLELLDSNYNPALDVGSEDKKYIKKEHYFIFENGNLIKIKKNKRKVLKIFYDKAEKVKQYAKENSLRFKDDYDLAKIFEYYNSL